MEPRPEPDYVAAIGALALRFALLVAFLAAAWRLLGRRLDRARVSGLFRALLLLIVYAAVATTALDLFMSRWGFIGDNAKRGFEVMLEHRSELPFAYRVLTPEVIVQLSTVLGPSIREGREEWLLRETPLLRYKKAREHWDLEKAVAWHVAYGLLFAALLGALFAARALAAAVYRGPPLQVDFAPALAGLLLPLTFWRGGYLYDFPELFFLFSCVLCIARQRWWLYYPLFVLACLNKESNALIVVYFAAWTLGRMPMRTWATHAAAQLVLGGGIVLALRLWFSASPGSGAWFFLPVNVLYLMEPLTYLGHFEAYGPLVPFPLAFNALSLFLVGFALFWRFDTKPAELRRALLYLAVTLLPLYALFGFVDEVRALSIAYPALFLAGFHTVRDLYGSERFTPAPPPAPPPARS